MDELIKRAKEFYYGIELPGLGRLITVTDHWRNKVDAARGAIEMAQTVEDVIAYAQSNKRSGFDHRVSLGAADRNSLIEKKHAEITKRFPDFDLTSSGLGESPLSDPMSIKLMEGVPVSNIFYYHLEAYLACMRYLNSNPKRVIEIGGGYGALARLFTLGSPKTEYVIIDLPESLFFSYVFINANFPEHKVKFVPAYEYAQHTEADIVITQGTMQEMPFIMVQTYMSWLAAGDFKAFYSLNYQSTPFSLLESWEEIFMEDDPVIVILDSPLHWRELCLKRISTNSASHSETSRGASWKVSQRPSKPWMRKAEPPGF